MCVLLNRLIGVAILAFFYTLPSLFNFSLFQAKSWPVTTSTSFAVSLSTSFFHVHAFFLFASAISYSSFALVHFHHSLHSVQFSGILRAYFFTEGGGGVSFLRVTYSEGEQTFILVFFSSFLYSFSSSGWWRIMSLFFFLSLWLRRMNEGVT